MDLAAYTVGEAADLAWGLQLKCDCGHASFLGAERLAQLPRLLTCAAVAKNASCSECGQKGVFAYIKQDVSARDSRDRAAKAAEGQRLAKTVEGRSKAG